MQHAILFFFSPHGNDSKGSFHRIITTHCNLLRMLDFENILLRFEESALKQDFYPSPTKWVIQGKGWVCPAGLYVWRGMTTGYSRQAGGTHRTGMLSCFINEKFFFTARQRSG